MIGQLAITSALFPLLLQDPNPHVVNIASSLAYFSAMGVGAYSSSKAALVSLHETLEEEVLSQHPNFKFSLYVLGQIKSTMFEKDTPNRVLAPLLEPQNLAKIIIQNLYTNKSGRFYYPFYARFMPLLRFFPLPIQKLARLFSGMDKIYS